MNFCQTLMKLDENYTSGKNDNCIFSKVLNKNYVDMALSLNNGKLEFETKFNDNVDSSILETYPTFLPNQWYHIGYSIDFTESQTNSISNKKNGLFKYYINGIMHTKYKLKYNLNLPYDNNIECAQKESIINIIDSGGNKYVFNNSSTYDSSKIIGFWKASSDQPFYFISFGFFQESQWNLMKNKNPWNSSKI